jgi:hypothetical protein
MARQFQQCGYSPAPLTRPLPAKRRGEGISPIFNDALQ